MRGTAKLALVTGATGFVGRQLCPALQQAGYALRAVFIEPTPPVDWPAAIEWIRIDGVGPNTDWAPSLQGGVTHVVHLAAVAHRIGRQEQVSDAVYDEVNHQGTLQLAQAIRQVPSVQRLFFMSSIGAVASMAMAPVNEQTPCTPDTPYGRSKLAAEKAIAQIFGGSATDWCIFRPPLLYGPGNPGNMARLLALVRLSLPLPLGAIRNRRTFLYVGNLVDAICLALEHPAASRKTFCVSDEREMSTPELLEKIAQATGRRVRLVPFPVVGLRAIGAVGSLFARLTKKSLGFDLESVEKLCGSLAVDSSLFRRTCGWTPPFTVEEGLNTLFGPQMGPGHQG